MKRKEKECKRCGLILPIEMFRKSRGYYRPYCKHCDYEQNKRAYWDKHGDMVTKREDRFMEKLKREGHDVEKVKSFYDKYGWNWHMQIDNLLDHFDCKCTAERQCIICGLNEIKEKYKHLTKGAKNESKSK